MARKEITPLTVSQVSLFLQEIKGTINEDMLFIDVFTGMRQSEILGLTWDCVNFDKGTITIYRQFKKERHFQKGGTYEFSSLKNNRPRVLNPAPQVMDVLKRIKERQENYEKQSEGMWSNPEGFVFTNHFG